MRASFRAEMMKLRRRPAVWTLAGVWVALLLSFAYLLPWLVVDGGAQGDPAALASVLPVGMVPTAISGFALFGGALALVLGALVSGSEYGWGTVKTILTQRPGRLPLLGGLVGALAAVMLAMVALTFALSAGASSLVALVEGAPLEWPGIGEIAQGMGAGWLILTMWCLLGVLLGMLTRGTAMAIGLGLVWSLVVEVLIRGVAALLPALDAVQKALPGVNAGSLLAALGATGQGDPAGGTPGVAAIVGGTQAVVVLAGFVVVFLGVTAVLQTRRDVA